MSDRLPSIDTTSRVLLILALGVALSGCKLPTVNLGTEEPIEVDITMRVDVYQHQGEEPEASEIKREYEAVVESQRNRMKEVGILKNSRWVGESHRGLLQVRELPAGDDGKWVKETVDAENADRLFLMRAEAKRRDMLLTEIQDEQWRSRVKDAFPGEWIEAEGDKPNTFRWVQKRAEPSQ